MKKSKLEEELTFGQSPNLNESQSYPINKLLRTNRFENSNYDPLKNHLEDSNKPVYKSSFFP